MAVEILDQGTRVFTSPAHTFGSDALLLARFCRPKAGQTAVDLCAGCGIVGLEWLDSGLPFTLYGVELAPQAAGLMAQGYAAYTGPASPAPAEGDARTLTLPCAGLVDLIACNPPYFTGGPASPCTDRARARHEGEFSLEEMAAFAYRHLRDGGKLTVCHKPDQAARLLAVLSAHRLEPKRLQTVRNQGKNTPWLVLVEAQKNRRPGLIWEPEQILKTGAALYGKKAENPV